MINPQNIRNKFKNYFARKGKRREEKEEGAAVSGAQNVIPHLFFSFLFFALPNSIRSCTRNQKNIYQKKKKKNSNSHTS